MELSALVALLTLFPVGAGLIQSYLETQKFVAKLKAIDCLKILTNKTEAWHKEHFEDVARINNLMVENTTLFKMMESILQIVLGFACLLLLLGRFLGQIEVSSLEKTWFSFIIGWLCIGQTLKLFKLKNTISFLFNTLRMDLGSLLILAYPRLICRVENGVQALYFLSDIELIDIELFIAGPIEVTKAPSPLEYNQDFGIGSRLNDFLPYSFCAKVIATNKESLEKFKKVYLMFNLKSNRWNSYILEADLENISDGDCAVFKRIPSGLLSPVRFDYVSNRYRILDKPLSVDKELEVLNQKGFVDFLPLKQESNKVHE